MAKRRRRAFVVGLTGSFGSGKTSVAKIWKKKGANVIDSDKLVHEVYKPNHPIGKKIKKSLRLKSLDRAQIGKIIFSKPALRKRLERMIHPYVFKRIPEIVRKSKKRVAVIEMPLLFETDFQKKVDVVVLVIGKKNEIEKRLLKKGFSKEEIRRRWKAQWTAEKRQETRTSSLIILEVIRS